MTRSFTKGTALICMLLTLMCTNSLLVAKAQGQTQFRDASLTLESGSSFNPPPGKVWIIVNDLNMEDRSRIELSDESPIFIIWTKNATIGNDVHIVAKGRDGISPGEAGKDAPTVVLIIENINEVRGLTISATGGSGSNGERGGKGRNGREASCSGDGAQDGGRGGVGGPGGDAGNGGKVFLLVPQAASGYGITINARAGRAGSGGLGGPGGDGGRGKDRCGVWPYWKRGSGNAGPQGAKGPSGEIGMAGIFRTYTIADFQERTIANTLTAIASVLNREGYGGDASELSTILQSGIPSSNQ